MNKKILIGSIIAIAILIGVSFTSVVGYRSVESGVKASPLFNIRTSRAIDENNQELSCEYVGKGEEITLPLQVRDNRLVYLHKCIDRISKLHDKGKNKIINDIRNLDGDIDDLKKFIVNNDDTSDVPCTVICTWEMNFCYFWLLFEIITGLIILPFYVFATILNRGFCNFWSLACLYTWECDI